MIDPKLIERLDRATSEELYALSLVIGRLIADPRRVLPTKVSLHRGQTIQYVALPPNGQLPLARNGRVIELGASTVTIQADDDRRYYKIPYAAVLGSIDPSPVTSSACDSQDTNKHTGDQLRDSLAVGQRAVFDDKYFRKRFGIITRLNAKTATIRCEDGTTWRVGYGLLNPAQAV